jgi:hypothetical protein
MDDDAVESVEVAKAAAFIVHDPSAVDRAEASAGTDGEPYGHS